MKTFADKTGTLWHIDLLIGTVNRVRATSDGRFDLWRPNSQIDGKPMVETLWDDLPTVWELLWHLISPQAEERGICAEDFGLLMAGDHLIAAQIALHEEWADFFRSLQKPDQAMALEKMTLYRAKAVQLMRTRLETDPDLKTLDERVQKKLDATLSSSLGNLRASLESILEDTPGGS